MLLCDCRQYGLLSFKQNRLWLCTKLPDRSRGKKICKLARGNPLALSVANGRGLRHAGFSSAKRKRSCVRYESKGTHVVSMVCWHTVACESPLEIQVKVDPVPPPSRALAMSIFATTIAEHGPTAAL